MRSTAWTVGRLNVQHFSAPVEGAWRDRVVKRTLLCQANMRGVDSPVTAQPENEIPVSPASPQSAFTPDKWYGNDRCEGEFIFVFKQSQSQTNSAHRALSVMAAI